MDLRQIQLWSYPQRVVLRTLAEAAANGNAIFLEVGSWCGDSSVILGEVAKKSDGRLFCVDWWMGSEGTDLTTIAQRTNVYSYFWNHICKNALEEVVIPIRARSDLVPPIMMPESFDMVFIDADHRYGPTLADIQAYSKLVKQGGILCGHDCEGRIEDFSREFLETGKNIDFHEAVHCGVVLAVSQSFEKYSLNQSIWSVRRAKCKDSWVPTNLTFPDIEDQRQLQPPPFLTTPSYSISRYGKKVYALPTSQAADCDLTKSEVREAKDVLSAKTVEELLAKINEPTMKASSEVVADYEEYFLIEFMEQVYGVAEELGAINLGSLDPQRLKNFQEKNLVVVGKTVPETEQLILDAKQRRAESDASPDPEGVLYKQKSALELMLLRQDALIDQMCLDVAKKDEQFSQLKYKLARKDEAIDQLHAEISKRDDKTSALEAALGDKEAHVNSLENDLAERQDKIGSLENDLAEKEKHVSAMEQAIKQKDADIVDLTHQKAEKVAQVDSLWLTISEKDISISDIEWELSEKEARIASLVDELTDKQHQLSNIDKKLIDRLGWLLRWHKQ